MPVANGGGQPCVFFDRDGVVNRVPAPGRRYIESAAEFELLPGFLAALRVAAARGYAAVVVTNQKGVGKGVITVAALEEVHDRLRMLVRGAGLKLLDIFVCTATDDTHPQRKPNPGMLIEAARQHGLDLQRSWMVGDHPRDIEAGRRAGCRTVFVGPAAKDPGADRRVDDVEQLAPLLDQVLTAPPL